MSRNPEDSNMREILNYLLKVASYEKSLIIR
jgi:hypothetical protein